MSSGVLSDMVYSLPLAMSKRQIPDGQLESHLRRAVSLDTLRRLGANAVLTRQPVDSEELAQPLIDLRPIQATTGVARDHDQVDVLA